MNSAKVLFLAILPNALIGQGVADLVPLENWPTPHYFQPTRAEREATEKAVPELQFSASQLSPNALSFVAVTPCRLVDTRGLGAGFNGIAPFSGPSIAPATGVTFPVQSSTEASANTAPAPCGTIPSIAQAYSFNVTLVPKAAGQINFVTVWPSGAAQPTVATMNDKSGVILSNAAIVPAGTPSGGISVYNSGPGTTDVIIDMNGFFAAPTDLNRNTAIGAGALASNTTGCCNTASGTETLESNTTGSQNTASGSFALNANTTGGGNTAIGFDALLTNTTGNQNVAMGLAALLANTTGSQNTAIGSGALLSNTTGANNTANGQAALSNNTTGAGNAAFGDSALQSNTAGGTNAALGENALADNTTGGGNTAVGHGALVSNTTGSGNIALGNHAGKNAPAGNGASIYIGNQGSATDAAATIQIGTQGTQTGGTYIAGISGVTSANGVEVFINSSGKLGTALSSSRFKEQITDMGEASSNLLQLRPVSYYYKPEYDDGSHLLQYGLVAEEVAKVYPEMVAYGQDGKPLTVRYQLLAPMLLNELQKQAEQIRHQAEQIRQEAEQNHSLEQRLAALETLLPAALASAR